MYFEANASNELALYQLRESRALCTQLFIKMCS